MVNLYSAAYIVGDKRDRDAGGCDDAHTLSRARKGKKGQRRHWCVKDTSDNLKYREDGGGHNPCRGVGNARFVGGGMDGNGNWRNYSGKPSNYKNAPFGLRCEGVNVSDGALRSWSGNDQTLTAGVNDNRGGFKSLYQQAVFGVETASGRTDGYCANINNLNKVIHKNGKTCYDMISSAVQQKAQGIQYCKQNPRDPKCKCINVAGSGFIDYCKRNPTLPGCNEVVKGIADFEKAGLKSATGLFGNADCIVPNVCSGDVFQPLSPVPACANKTAICNQVMQMDNITAYAGVKAVQGCNINFEAEQKKKDDAKKAAADKAAADRAAADRAAADRAAADRAAADRAAADRAAADRAAADRAAAGKAAADKAAADKAAADKAAADKAVADKAAAAKAAADTAAAKAKAAGASPAEVQAAADKAAADVESKPIEDFVKPTGFGGFSTTQLGIGAGGAILLCCCVIILVLAMSGGGGESSRFRR
jgi:hypothetical protein